jgi:hypothetical protein
MHRRSRPKYKSSARLILNSPAHNFRIIGVLLAAAVILSLPIFYFGMPIGNDLPQHFRFAIAFYDALRNGEVYPSWIGETNLGFGDAGVRFYPPLAYYVVALFRFLVPTWNAALASSICFWFFVGGAGVYLLAREWASERASLIAALLFMLMPYHVNQVYNAGLFGEFAGLAILPFCFFFVQRIISGGRSGDVAGLSAAYALLVLAHLPLSIVGSVALAIYSVALLSRAGWSFTTIGKLTLSIVTAAAASSFYWARMVLELSFVKHTLPEFTDRAYDFRFNFLASLLYLPAEKYEQTSVWFTDLLFVITLAMFLPGLAVWFIGTGRTDRRKLAPWLALFAFVLFLGTPLSLFLWEHISILQKIQFPWRLLGLLSLIGAVFVAISFDDVREIFRSKLRPVGILAVGFIIAGCVFTFAQVIRPAAYPDREAFEAGFERYRTDESFECWWPVWAKREAFRDGVQVSAPTRLIVSSTWTDQMRILSLAEGQAEKLRVATFYYPFWKATTHHGATLNVEPADDGTILVSVPTEATEVRLYFEEPAYESAARIVSAVAWLTLLGLAIATVFRRIAVRKIA